MQGPLDAFRRLLRSDASLHAALGEIDLPDVFIARAVDLAQAAGLAISRDDIAGALRPDPLGLLRPQDLNDDPAWPPPGWLPVSLAPGLDGRNVVEWIYFGGTALDQPFFDMSARQARIRPFNRLCCWRQDLDSFIAGAPELEPETAPQGLVFHMSRCGSTLVAQMLAASPRNVVLSEAPPIDAALRLGELHPGADETLLRRALLAMTAALGRGRGRAAQGDSRLFLKLDSWHTLALPLFRAAFPQTPWVFLYRNPVEVLVSQMRARGMQTVPGMLPAALQGADGADSGPGDAAIGGEDFCARVLATGCAATLAHFPLGGGLLVNYDELPLALFTKILPHFGVRPEAAEIDAMRAATQRDAKAPYMPFAQDGDDKRRAATTAAQAAAERHLAPIYAALEAMRADAAALA